MATTFNMYRGDTVTLNVAATCGGETVELTGCTLVFTAKYDAADTDANAVFTRTIGDGITITSPLAGLAEVKIVPANTENLTTDKTLVWDLELTDSDGNVYTVATGLLIVKRDVTRG